MGLGSLKHTWFSRGRPFVGDSSGDPGKPSPRSIDCKRFKLGSRNLGPTSIGYKRLKSWSVKHTWFSRGKPFGGDSGGDPGKPGPPNKPELNLEIALKKRINL